MARTRGSALLESDRIHDSSFLPVAAAGCNTCLREKHQTTKKTSRITIEGPALIRIWRLAAEFSPSRTAPKHQINAPEYKTRRARALNVAAL